MSNGEIADQLQITPSTVRSSVSNILGKFGYENRAQLAAASARRRVRVESRRQKPDWS